MPFRAPILPSKLVNKDVMDKVQNVMDTIITPSWINTVPWNFGHAAAGNLKADEWRIMATVHLPIALISLNVLGLKVLANTLDLFSAVRLASLNNLNQRRVVTYRQYIVRYIEGIKLLYSESSITANCHMAVHICDFMLLFGSIRSWWCFPFERVIGILQRQPSNHKNGKYTVSFTAWSV
ncbi:hypothetical protein M422DRAFT_186383 [Sphaerobolus stellatus SS14]|uniref:Uncharacterized protein n=1 Tax=Sphaerobolus stellatus (strain SS14) TaxID=990650 RepID=A0A0C9UPY0_SPHS4|nr:hypothetical protein M422DRAFT_186383 [Sphaerobolus stellatus SS14]